MTQIYEMMVLLDNDVVRQDWKSAKALVTGALEKQDAKVLTCRRWDERRLAYRIRRRNRATFYLAYFEMDRERIPLLRRGFDLDERVLRYLVLAVDAVPEDEAEKAAAEESSEFSVPPPPEDDAPDPEPEESEDGAEGARSEPEGAGAGRKQEKESGDSGETSDEKPSAEPAKTPAGTTKES